MDDNVAIIISQLQRLGGRQKSAGEYKMVQCPFHSDNSPSCGVYMRRDHTTKSLGFFHCFGCGASGKWNKFAEKAGLDTIKEWNSSEKTIDYNERADESALLGDVGLTLRSIYKEMNCPEASPWPLHINWRGVSGELIAAVGGKAINDERQGLAVLFPVKIGNKIVGAVKAVFQRTEDTHSAYMAMPGTWVKRFGLFPHAHTAKMIKRCNHKFVILVEGPRDALRLIKLGIPAIAVLGANTISKTKMLYVTSLGLDTIYVMPDNDRGGTSLWTNIKTYVPEARRLKLPRERDEDGKLIKMDPFSMPAEIARDLKRLMRERHGWTREK